MQFCFFGLICVLSVLNIIAFQEKSVTVESQNEPEEVIDIDLDDPEVGKAALKIQAGFRGHKARSEVQKRMVRTSRYFLEK